MDKLITPEFGTMFWTFLIFGLLLLVLGRFAWGPIIRMLEERERAVKADRDAAESAKADAEKMRAELDIKLRQLAEDVKAELAAAVRTGERERQELLAQAREQSEQMVSAARQDIERDRERLAADLRQYVADVSLAAAEKVLGERVDENAGRRIVEATLKDLEKKG